MIEHLQKGSDEDAATHSSKAADAAATSKQDVEALEGDAAATAAGEAAEAAEVQEQLDAEAAALAVAEAEAAVAAAAVAALGASAEGTPKEQQLKLRQENAQLRAQVGCTGHAAVLPSSIGC